MDLRQLKNFLANVSECGGITHRPRVVSWDILDKSGTIAYLGKNTEIEVSSTGDGCAGPEITLRLKTDQRVLIPEVENNSVEENEWDKDLYEVSLVLRFRGRNWCWPSECGIFSAKSPDEAGKQAIEHFRQQRNARFPGDRYNFEFKSAIVVNRNSGRAFAFALDFGGNLLPASNSDQSGIEQKVPNEQGA